METPPRLVDAITKWFQSHEDGDFCVHARTHRSVLTGDLCSAGSVIYLTKPACFSRIQGLAALPQPIATICRCGLPTEDDVESLNQSTTSARRIFIGDADPPDILAFAWLRAYLPIDWYGVNDHFLDRHGNLGNVTTHLRMSDNEAATVEMLSEWCPDFRELVGDDCTSLLEQGLKVELEGAMTGEARS